MLLHNDINAIDDSCTMTKTKDALRLSQSSLHIKTHENFVQYFRLGYCIVLFYWVIVLYYFIELLYYETCVLDSD